MVEFGIGGVVGLLVATAFVVMVARAAYRNGVTDGYGFSREPTCPGYRVAGEYLTKHMLHRWPDMLDRSTPDYEQGKPIRNSRTRTMWGD